MVADERRHCLQGQRGEVLLLFPAPTGNALFSLKPALSWNTMQSHLVFPHDITSDVTSWMQYG